MTTESNTAQHMDMPDGSSTISRLRTMIGSERFRWWFVLALIVAYAAVRAATSVERDPYWSAQAGLENLGGVPLIRADTWSWASDGLWYPNSPGWNLVLGIGWQALGFWGFFWVALLPIAMFLALALLIARRAGGRSLPTLLGFLPVLLVVSSGLSARATVVVQCLIFGAVLFGWWWGGVVRRLPAGIALVVVGGVGFAVSALGNWIHLSFMVMSGAIAVMWSIAWWASPGLRAGRRLAVLVSGTLGLVLGCIVSPYGILATLERSRAVEAACRGLVTEWMSVIGFLRTGDFLVIPMAVVAVCVTSAVIVFVVRFLRRGGRFDSRARLILPLAFFGVAAVLVGIGTVRFMLVGLLVLLPLTGPIATAFVRRVRRRQSASPGFWSRPLVIEAFAGRTMIVIILLVGLLAAPFAVMRISEGARPPEAAVIQELPSGCRAWTDDATAAAVILMRPDVPVWMDGRVDFHGRERVLDYLAIRSGEKPIPDEASCVVLPATWEEKYALPRALDHDAGWVRAAETDGYILWVRA